MSSLQDRLNRDPEVVKLEPGESLVGTVLELSARESDYGVYPLLVIETDDGRELEWHAFHTVAQNELAKVNPRPGDKVGVKCLGARTGKNGSTYTGYRVIVERGFTPNTDAEQAMQDAAERDLQADLARESLKYIDEDAPLVTPTQARTPDVSALKPPAVPTYEDEEAF